MNTHLAKEFEQFVYAKVQSGQFTSSDTAIIRAVRLLQQREQVESARVLDGVSSGTEDMPAGPERHKRNR
jgi:putative addiction module CopG family antidote